MPDTAIISSAKMNNMSNQALANIRKREDRAVSLFSPIRSASSTATGRTIDGRFSRNDSQETPITWTPHVSGFEVTLKETGINMISAADNWKNGMQGAIMDCMEKAEASYSAKLIAGLSQINAGGVYGAFDGATNTWNIPLADKENFFQNIKSNLKVNGYKGAPTVIMDTKAALLTGHQIEQGTGNSTNLGYQYRGMNMVETNNALITGGAAFNGSAIAFESGLCGVDFWIPGENRKSLDPVQALTTNGTLGQIIVPFFDANNNKVYEVPFALYVRTIAADTLATNGSAQDFVTIVEVSIDSAFIMGELSKATETPILGYKLLAA